MQMLARSIGALHTPKVMPSSSGKDATSFKEAALGRWGVSGRPPSSVFAGPRLVNSTEL